MSIDPLNNPRREDAAVLIDVIHDQGPEACGQVAFRITQRPRRTDRVDDINTIRKLDGTIPTHSELMTCGSCHRVIDYGAVTPDGGYDE